MERKEYKYDLHCHTKEVSRCGKVPAADIVKAYKEKGYDGIVITDHYSALTFRGAMLFCPQKYIDFYLSGYKKAKQAAGENFSVLLGMELRFYATIDDFLVYGLTEEFLKSSGNLMKLYLKRFFRLASRAGLLVLEAHPFRALHFRANPKYIHGCEVFNGKDIKPEINAKAAEWARKNNFAAVSAGSDFHDYPQLAKGGIITYEPVKSNEDLLRILKSGNYRIFSDT